MVEIISIEADDVIGVRVNGSINEEDLEAISKTIDDKLTRNDKLQIYAEIRSFGPVSIDALFKELKFALKNFDIFQKKAIVTDRKWIHKIVPVTDKVFPRIALQVFPFQEQDKAIEWLSGVD